MSAVDEIATPQVMRARAVNAEPWEPLPGMAKTVCRGCRYWFATPAEKPSPLCPDCLEEWRRRGRMWGDKP